MSTLSRRNLIAGAAVLPAITLPAIGAAAASDATERPSLTSDEFVKVYASFDDAAKEQISNLVKLLELGNELEAVIPRWVAQRRADIQENDALDAAAAGYPEIGSNELPLEEWREYVHKRCAAAQAALGPSRDPDLENWDRIHDKLWPIIAAIMAIKAPTLAGFKVQVRAMTVARTFGRTSLYQKTGSFVSLSN